MNNTNYWLGLAGFKVKPWYFAKMADAAQANSLAGASSYVICAAHTPNQLLTSALNSLLAFLGKAKSNPLKRFKITLALS